MLHPAVDRHPIQGEGEDKYSQLHHATETKISSGLIGHLVFMQTYLTLFGINAFCDGYKVSIEMEQKSEEKLSFERTAESTLLSVKELFFLLEKKTNRTYS